MGSFQHKISQLFAWPGFSPVLMGCACLFWTLPVYAQNVPATADPSRFIESLEIQPETEPQERVLEDADEPVSVLTPPEGAEQYKFQLRDIRLIGVTAYREDQLSSLYADMLGREVSVADIFTLANRITQKYRNHGFILARTSIPPQEIDGGTVRIEVIEGQIENVFLQGLDYSPGFIAREIIEKIKKTVPFNARFLERQLLMLNRVTGISAVGILQPVQDPDTAMPGAVDLNLIASPRDNQYSVSIDNYGSNYVGPWQAGIAARLPHTALFDGVTDLALYTAPQTREIAFFSATESIPLTTNGLLLKLSAKYSRSEPGGSLENLDLKSRYVSFAAQLEYPLHLNRESQLDIFGDFEVNNSKSDFLNTRFYDDRLRIVRAGVRGSHKNIYGGALSGEARLSQGLDILGVRESGSIDLSRAQGRSNFAKVDARLSYHKALSEHIGLKTNIAGQVGFHPLLSSEEFGYGGYALGRGYNNSEITGDSGFGFLTELSYYKWAQPGSHVLRPGFVPFVYYDFGKVWNKDDNTNPESGASAGVGIELNWKTDTRMRFTVAQPLSRKIQNPSYGNGKNPRFLVSLTHQF